jgi:predicted small secreted protein
MSASTNHCLRKLSPAVVLAMLALVVALGGTATAAGVLVTSEQIKDGTIQTADISKSAQAQLKRTESRGNSIEGSWIVTVTRVNPPPNVPRMLKALMTFGSGGGMTEASNTSNTATTLRGPAHGVWERIDGRLYATTMLFFRFNPQTGALLGTQKVNRTMRLSQDGQTFEAVSLATQYEPDGVLTVGGLRATETGERIDVERIPDQP